MASFLQYHLEVDTIDSPCESCERALWSPAPGGPLAASLSGIPSSTPLSAELTIRLSTSLLKRRFLQASVDLSKPEDGAEFFDSLKASLNAQRPSQVCAPRTYNYKSLSFKRFEAEEQRDFTEDLSMEFEMPSADWDQHEGIPMPVTSGANVS
jgi:hypothetical protein